jgi:hypothetical protein
MANCPNCCSGHITLKRETNVSWGRAVAGWALFGVVGGAVGAVTGEDRNVNACLDCGASWKAEDLYKILKNIENMTGERLNLAREQDRLYMNSFISEIGPYIESISNVDKEAEKLISDSKKKLEENAAIGCGMGCLTSIFIGCTASVAGLSGYNPLIIFITPMAIGWCIGGIIDSVKKRSVLLDIEKAKIRAISLRPEAEERLHLKVEEFTTKYLL